MSSTVRALPRRPREVLLTGVTGFVGQAVLERFLREDAVIHVTIRPRTNASAAERLDSLLSRSAFDTWRSEVGPAGVARARSRLHVIEADLTEDLPPLPPGIDLVVHSASSVSFDEPWDHAIRANVVGPRNLYTALQAHGEDPHVIHVSTSYVGTDRTNTSHEEPVDHDVDWHGEVQAAFDLRDSQRGSHLHATATEADAVMRTAGRRRAAELGWTDVYTMTKALGERVAEQMWGETGHRLTILRPTIIESALARPHPGWLDGFKVADPLIAAFAKGRLVAFPGRPDAVLDIVPVDIVVDAIMAAALVPHRAQSPRYLQVGTSTSNPITLDEFRRHIEDYVHAHPWTDRSGAPIHPRPWRFLAPHDLDSWAGRRAGLLRRTRRLLDLAPDRLAATTRIKIDTALRGITLLRDYVGIYQPYSCSRTVYDDARTRELLAEARELDVAGALDVTQIDWAYYLRCVHMPGLTRVAEAHRRRGRDTSRRAPGPSPATRPHRAGTRSALAGAGA